VKDDVGSVTNNNKEMSDESLNHTHDSTGSIAEIAEFSDDEEVPVGEC
jgi:hypothetical protein